MISVCRSILGDYEQWGSEVRRIVVFRMDAIANRGGVWAPGRRWLSSFLGLGLQTAPALRRGYWRHTLGYFFHVGLRGEGWTPVPLPPPARPKPSILRANLLAIKPNNGGDFSFELRTHHRQSRHIILRKAHSSPKLWTPQIRYGSRNFSVSKGL